MKVLKYILLTVISISMYAQRLDSLALSKIGEKLIAEELKTYNKKYDGKDNCVRDEEGNYLSCFSAESSPKWVTDFNNDGNPDAVFQFTDEGLGGGGNAFGYDFRIILLDKNLKILDQQSFFGGGKMSFATLSIDAVKNGKISATYEENPYGNINYNENMVLKNTALTFSLKDGKVIEESYTNCPFSKMQKQIFLADKGFSIVKNIGLDDQFNEELWETAELPNKVKYKASLSGCEDLDLYFTRTISYRKDLENNRVLIKKILLDDLLILQESTIFQSVIKSTYSRLQKTKPENIKLAKYGGTDIHFILNDNWKANLFVSGNKEQGSFITFRFVKTKNTKQMDFWESMDSKKKLKAAAK